MRAYLTKESQTELFKQYGGTEQNTGKSEAQIALFTARIKGPWDNHEWQ